MEELLFSPAFQSHLVLALAGLTSLYITLARPTLSRGSQSPAPPHDPSSSSSSSKTRGSQPTHGSVEPSRSRSSSNSSPAATLFEAGSSPALPSARLALLRGVLAVYIYGMGATQLVRLGAYVFKFYTIWNWWLLGTYFALAALASWRCARLEAAAASADKTAAGGNETGSKATAKQTSAAAAAAVVSANGRAAPPGRDSREEQGQEAEAEGGRGCALHASGPLARWCHALFLTNAATVIIVDAVCWGLLYPMLARGPQTPEIERIIKRLLLTFTSYNQHGLNAAYIFADLLLNRHRLAFHALGPLGLWSLVFALWAHAWHALTGKWLYPFLDTSKPWAPVAYLGLYLVHWLAFGLVALLYRLKGALYSRAGAGAAKVEKLE